MRFCFILFMFAAGTAAWGQDSSQERKVERLETEIRQLQKDRRDTKAAVIKARQDLAEATREWDSAKRALEDDEKKPGSKPEELRQAVDAAARKKADCQLALTAALAADQDLKDEVENKEDKLEKASEAKPPKKPQERREAEECLECKKAQQAPNQGKNGWEVFADVIKAATPLGLGAMSTYGNIQAMKTQSSDYRYYNNSMTSNGLAASPPMYSYTSGISGLNNYSMSGMGAMGGLSLGLGGSYGMYGSSYFPTYSTGMGGWNGWGSYGSMGGYSGYGGYSGIGGFGGFGLGMNMSMGLGLGGYGGYSGLSGYGNYGSYGGYGAYSGYGYSNYGLGLSTDNIVSRPGLRE